MKLHTELGRLYFELVGRKYVSSFIAVQNFKKFDVFNSFIIGLSLSLIFKNFHGVNNDHKGLKNITTLLFTTFRSITPSSGNRLPLKPLKICLRNLFAHACKNDVSEKFKLTKRIRIKFLDY